ncbi:MAG: hypothetical protein SGILL_004973, partial [Bacillariaceae sp.]
MPLRQRGFLEMEEAGGENSRQSDMTAGILSEAQRRIQDDENLLVTSNDSEIIRQTLRLYGSLYFAIFLVFCYVRRRFPRLYNIRAWVPELKCDLAQQTSYGIFNWAWNVFRVTDDQLLTNCGMDAMCFLRCLRLGTKLSLIGCFNAIWLIPTFYTAGGLSEIEEEDKFVLMSVANLHPGSPRFAAVVVAAYIMVIASLYLLFQEYNWYIQYRHKFLSLRVPRNFAVYVSGIPEALQSDHALTDFFQRAQWASTVLEANVAMNIPKLEAKVTKREVVLQKLEHAMVEEKLKGKKQTHRTFNIQNATHDITTVSQTVDSVQAYQKELDELNKSISLEIGKVKNSNHRLRRHLTKQQCDSNILRGRTLTPSYDELRTQYNDIESGSRTLSQDISMPSMAMVQEDSSSFYSQNSSTLESRRSVLDHRPIISEEIPEEDAHLTDADFQILPAIKSGDGEDGGDESPTERREEGIVVDSNSHSDVGDHPFLQLVGLGNVEEV